MDKKNAETVCHRAAGANAVRLARAQSSLEFLYAVGLILLIFGITMIIFYQSQEDLTSLSAAVESRRICQTLAGQISAVASGGDGTAALLRLPLSLYRSNYTVLVTSANRSLAVSYGLTGSACTYATGNVTNGTSGTFYILNSTRIRNVNGGVVVG